MTLTRWKKNGRLSSAIRQAIDSCLFVSPNVGMQSVSSVRGRPQGKNVTSMKKAPLTRSQNTASDDMRPEYSFDYRKARPNRFAERIRKDPRVVILDPDISEIFPTSESVNTVLRADHHDAETAKDKDCSQGVEVAAPWRAPSPISFVGRRSRIAVPTWRVPPSLPAHPAGISK